MTGISKDMEIATFKFGIISEFVTGVHLERGEKERLIREKCERKYKIPHSSQTRITKSTLKKWITDYRDGGERIEGLMPKKRKDKGTFRSLDKTLQMAIKEVMNDRPSLTGIALITELQHRKYISPHEKINLSVLYRFLHREKLFKKAIPQDRRSFEASGSNELWQSDVMHGPKVLSNGKLQKAYLIAIMDDFSRLIIHAEFYLSEKLIDFKDCLKKAVERRGLPQKLYVDNGACFKSLNVEQIGACLQFAIVHTPPYTPQGRGKIERWFRFVRDNFLVTCPLKMTLKELNELFENWLEGYQHRVHSVTKESPLKRYQSAMQCVRPAPKNLIEYFRMIKFRRVKKDRTFQLNGIIFEAPTNLIDERIEVRYHHDSPEDVEIFLNDMSYGKATLLNRAVNYLIARTKILSVAEESAVTTGELFGGKSK